MNPFVFILCCVLFLILFIVVYFLFLYVFTDHCHRVETQLQLISCHIISYHIISYHTVSYLTSHKESEACIKSVCFSTFLSLPLSRRSLVWYSDEATGFESLLGQEILTSLERAVRLCFQLSLMFSGYRRSLPRVKRPRPEINHAPASSAEVKNEWSYTSTPPIFLRIVGRENFTSVFLSLCLFLVSLFSLPSRFTFLL